MLLTEVAGRATGPSREPAAALPLRAASAIRTSRGDGLLLIAQFLDRGLGLLIPLHVAHMPGIEADRRDLRASSSRSPPSPPRSPRTSSRGCRAACPSGACSLIGLLPAARSAPPWRSARAGVRCSSCARSPASARRRLTLAYSLGAASCPRHDRGAAFGWLALGVQVGTAASPLVTGALAAVSLPGAFVLSGVMAWVAAALLFFGARGLLSRRADAST